MENGDLSTIFLEKLSSFFKKLDEISKRCMMIRFLAQFTLNMQLILMTTVTIRICSTVVAIFLLKFLKNEISFSRKIVLRSPFSMQFLFGDKEFSTHSDLRASVLSVEMNARVQTNQTRAMYSNRKFRQNFLMVGRYHQINLMVKF